MYVAKAPYVVPPGSTVAAIETPVDLRDPIEGSPEFEAARVRTQATHSIDAMPWLSQLPELPDGRMRELHDRIEEAERKYAAPNLSSEEYGPGTASSDDEIARVDGPGEFLFTAPHATKSIRRQTGALGFADTGTAGLTAVLADSHGHGFIMTGRQTGSGAIDEYHPLKEAVRPHLPTATGFIDVHGSASHLFVNPNDRYNIHASIGLGENPTEARRELGQALLRFARNELGLYVVVGNDQGYYSQKGGTIRRHEDGTAYTGRLAGTKPNMMNNFARREMAAAANSAPSMQIELAGFARILARNVDKRDRRSRVVGVALGYMLFEHAVKLMKSGDYNETQLA